MAQADSNAVRILIGYDGSDRARSAITLAGRLFPGATATVAHIFHPVGIATLSSVPPLAAPVTNDPDIDKRAEEARQRQAAAVAEAGVALATGAGLRADALTAMANGTSGIWSALVHAADERDATLIVVGARGHSGIASALLGSVSDGVVHHARRPVLVVPDRRHE